MLLLAAFACAPEPTPAPDAETETAYACPDPGPIPEGTTWAPTGDAPAAGLSTLASAGRYPLLVGSVLAGIWRLNGPDDLGLEALPAAQTTHTIGDLVVAPQDPLLAYRSAGGMLTRTEDGGATWVSTEFGSRDEASAFPGHVYAIAVPTDARDRVYAVLDTGVFGVSADRGESWEARGMIAVEGGADAMIDYYRRFRMLAGRAAEDPILLHDGRFVWRSTDEGWSWTATLADVGSPSAFVANPADPTQLFLSGRTSADAGATWTEGGPAAELAWWGEALLTVAADALTLTGPDGDQRSVALPTTGTTGVASVGTQLFATDDTSAWHSEDGGASWQWYEHSNVEKNFSVVTPHPVCPGVAWVGTRCDSGVYRTEDWGRTWARMPVHGHYVMDLVFDPANPRRLWLVNDDMLMRSDDEGGSWALAWQEFHFHGFALDPDVPGRLLLGSVGSGDYADRSGQIYVSTDDGASWAPTLGIPPNTASAHSFVFLGGGVVLAGFYKAGDESHRFGHGIGLFRSVDGGLSWAPGSLPSMDVARVVSHDAIAWAAGDAGIHRSDDAGATWTPVLEGNFRWVDVVADLALALEDDGTIHLSEDGGKTWSEDRTAPGEVPMIELENPLARVAIAPAGDFAWWTHYGHGIETRAFSR